LTHERAGELLRAGIAAGVILAAPVQKTGASQRFYAAPGAGP